MTSFRVSTIVPVLLPSFLALAGDFLTYEQFGAMGDGLTRTGGKPISS